MSDRVKIKIVSESGVIPQYATPDSAGFDISAYLPDGDMVIAPGDRALIPTGIRIELPPGYEAQLRARSGLAIKRGIGLVNGIGTIDADYRGEVKIALINWGKEDFTISSGDRIAQIVVSKYERAEFLPCDELEDSERGEGGFGHTGV